MENLPTFTNKQRRLREAVNLEALERVVNKFGDRAKLARALGLSRSYTWLWTEVPAAQVRVLSILTGFKPEEILPDPYPYPPEESDEKAKKRQGRKAAG